MDIMSITRCASAQDTFPRKVVDRIALLRNPVVVAHVVPDTDALGSMFGFALAYAGNGCRPKVGLPKGERPPQEFTRPEIADILSQEHEAGVVARKPLAPC